MEMLVARIAVRLAEVVWTEKNSRPVLEAAHLLPQEANAPWQAIFR